MNPTAAFQKLQDKMPEHSHVHARAMYDYCLSEEDRGTAQAQIKIVRRVCLDAIRAGRNAEEFRELLKRTYLFAATDDLDSYMTYLEWNRKAEDKFYLPRRKVLKRVVDHLQGFVDGTLDEFFISMPPRTGKTSLLMFFMTWIIGRNPEASNLYSAYSDVITTAFYNGVLEIINDPNTYHWKSVFPASSVVQTNAKDETLNIDRRKRYPSLTCRSLYGTLNGACDCDGILVSDDLISGIEEALSKDRLVSAWNKVDNNLLPRAKETAKVLWCGTRWAEIDPIGMRMDLLINDSKFRNRKFEIINIPALDEQDESRFDYPYEVGFSTEYYHQRRASFERNNDLASWMAQYCGEPIERSGALFTPEDFETYNGVLPPGDPDRIFMAVDPSWGGRDFTAGPVCYEYGEKIYVHDVVYSDADKSVTRPLIIEKIKAHNVTAALFEANKMTEDYPDFIEEGLKKEGYRLSITKRAAPNDKAKEIRIFDRAPEIRELIFLDNGKRSKEYQQFMQNVFAFKVQGKNKTDDAPDSLALAIDMVRGVRTPIATAFKRPF